MTRTALMPCLLSLSLAACNVAPLHEIDPRPLERAGLPVPDVALAIAQLGPCTDGLDRTLHLDSGRPVAVLVHGCKGSAGRFRSLAQLYAFHGQQAICFNYDDRESLVRAAAELVAAVDELASHLRDRNVTVIGHSMGGLVARKAMEDELAAQWRHKDADLKLVTVSAPVAGIAVALRCASRALQWASLGAVPAVCWAITGDNWHEITAPSDFISHPGVLLPSVRSYLKVVTNERDGCRRRSAEGVCTEADFVFSLPEQYQPIIDAYPRLTNVQVDAGHVEIVGYKDAAPRKLLAILQANGMIAQTPPGRRSALERLLAELY